MAFGHECRSPFQISGAAASARRATTSAAPRALEAIPVRRLPSALPRPHPRCTPCTPCYRGSCNRSDHRARPVRRAPATRLSPERERERRRRHGTQQHLDCKSPHGPRKGTCDRVHEHTTWPIMSTRSRIRDSGVARGSVGTPAPSPLRRASQTRSISASRFSAVSIICPRRRKTSGSKTALCVRR